MIAQERPRGTTLRPRSGAAAALCWSSREEILHTQGKRNPSKTVGTERGHQREKQAQGAGATGTGCRGNPVGPKEPLETRTHFACHVEWRELPTLSSLGSGMLVLLQDTKHFCTGRGCPIQNARGASAEEHWTPRWPGDSNRGRG